MRARAIFNWIGMIAAVCSVAVVPATQPVAPDLTPRQQNLLSQLADAEANIQAINKALKNTGYSVGFAYDRIDSSLRGNEIMDRKGGGPVRWDEFYGKTAKDYPRTGFWDDRMDDHRPQQFAFVYKANNDQIVRAKAQIASLVQNQQGLLDRRQKHESDQSELWATLSWEQVKDREIEFRPLYRFALKPNGPEASVLRPVILFLRTADSVTHDGLESIHTDQAVTFQTGRQRMAAAYTALQKSLADVLDAADLKPDRAKEGQALKALCKDLTEQSKVIADDHANALDRDKAKEDNSKLEFRGQLQGSLSSFSTELGKLDEEIGHDTESWGIVVDRAALTTDAVPQLPAVQALNPVSQSQTPVAVSFSVGSTEFGTIKEGVRFFSDRAYPLEHVPDEMVGLQFTRRPTGPSGYDSTVAINSPAGATAYLLVDVSVDPDLKDPAHVKYDRELSNSGWTRLVTAVLTTDYGHHLLPYKRTFTEAVHLTLPGIFKAGNVIVVAKNLELTSDEPPVAPPIGTRSPGLVPKPEISSAPSGYRDGCVALAKSLAGTKWIYADGVKGIPPNEVFTLNEDGTVEIADKTWRWTAVDDRRVALLYPTGDVDVLTFNDAMTAYKLSGTTKSINGWGGGRASSVANPMGEAGSNHVDNTRSGVMKEFPEWNWIVNKQTGDYLFVISDNKNQGNFAFVGAVNDSDSEKWKLGSIAGFDGVKVVNKYSNRCIGVRGESKKSGMDIIEWSEWAPAQVYDKPLGNNWKMEAVGDSFKFVNEISGQCLTEKDKRAYQEPWSGSDDQLWHITPTK